MLASVFQYFQYIRLYMRQGRPAARSPPPPQGWGADFQGAPPPPVVVGAWR